MLQIQLHTACEGPLALNDNASELCREFIKPHGDRFFTQVSRYGDYLADIAKKPEYQAGDTLKLILPFLKAHGLTNAMIRDFSSPKPPAAVRGGGGLQVFAPLRLSHLRDQHQLPPVRRSGGEQAGV